MYKKCCKCKEDKLLSCFVNRHTRYSDGKDPWCKDCKRNHTRLCKYGITNAEYDEMLIKQNNRCYICKTHESELNKVGNKIFFTLCIDHSHKTGKVRKLLCQQCNRALGLFKEDVNIFINAIEYIKYHDNTFTKEISKIIKFN